MLRQLPRRLYSTQTRQLPFNGTAIGLSVLGATTAAYFLWPDVSRSAPTSNSTPLSPAHFTPSTLVLSEQCSHDSKLLKLTIPKHLIPPKDTPGLKPVWSVFIKDDDIQVERPYTPLEGIDEEGNMLFWIKKYPKGEVGRWLHSKSVGDTIELRGPLTSWHWKEDAWDEIVMISGGTGITPFYQLFHSVIRHPHISPETRFTLIHGSRSTKDLPPPVILGPLLSFASVHPSRLTISLHVDQSEKDLPSDIQTGFINKTAISRAVTKNKAPWWKTLWGQDSSNTETQKRVLFLVCGPDPMIASIAGPFGRNLSQGSIGGVLGEMGYNNDQVWKL